MIEVNERKTRLAIGRESLSTSWSRYSSTIGVVSCESQIPAKRSMRRHADRRRRSWSAPILSRRASNYCSPAFFTEIEILSGVCVP